MLDHAEVVRLADEPGGPTTRYTTRTVLASEQQVLRAADGLSAGRPARSRRSGSRRLVLGGERFGTMRADQRAAFERATGAEGLSLIDGQAGTGKSFTMAAIREAYEASGRNVIGLAPTNAVAQDMQRDGFRHAGTVHSELFALKNGRRQWDDRTVVMVDEAAMIDTKLMADVDRARPRRRREADPGRRRPAALQHRSRRDVRRTEGPLRRRGTDRGDAASTRTRTAAPPR